VSGFNPVGVLHGEHEFIFHRPIPPEGELITEGAIAHYYDKGKDKGALVVAEYDRRQSDGRKLFTSVVTMFARLDGASEGRMLRRNPCGFPIERRMAKFQAGPRSTSR